MDFYTLLSIVSAAAIHEIGHVFAASLLGVKLSGFSLTPTEARIVASGILSYKAEWLIAAFGPIFNLLTALFCTLFFPEADRLTLASLMFATLNLMPISGFDGGRICACALSLGFGDRISIKVCRFLSILNIMGLWMISVFFMIRTASALSLFMFSVTLFVHLKEQ